MTIYKKIFEFIFFFFVSINVFAQYELGKYHIMQYRANVRMEPTRNSEVIAILSLHDEIDILEYFNHEEEINGMWNYWYKIKYGNIIGYTFGGNIAYKKLITDIDKNGINDYFYVRFSSLVYNKIHLATDDIVIYINNQRINTNFLYEHPSRENIFWRCEFVERNDHVIIDLETYGGDHGSWNNYYFEVTYRGGKFIGTKW
jgi:hypothetical protein